MPSVNFTKNCIYYVTLTLQHYQIWFHHAYFIKIVKEIISNYCSFQIQLERASGQNYSDVP